jgi:hypothetical protein
LRRAEQTAMDFVVQQAHYLSHINGPDYIRKAKQIVCPKIYGPAVNKRFIPKRDSTKPSENSNRAVLGRSQRTRGLFNIIAR